ncbi:hypothetical protein [Nocardiopsis sp. CA-288880]|uniref:hypothetical protein n=1 Tax=Nocardiopsis sp. CA-288880 TaxID=3239995 RepID=UPI003D986158
MASPTATAEPPPPRVGNEPAARQHTAHDRRNMSVGAPDAPQSASGAGDVASETQAALSSVTRFAAWVLDYLARIFLALLQAVLGLAMLVLRPVARLAAAFVRWRVRRGRIPIRIRIRSRLRQAGRARAGADARLREAVGRADAHVASARSRGEGMVRSAGQTGLLMVHRALSQAKEDVAAARERRGARIADVRQRADRLVAQARRTGGTNVRRATWQRDKLIRDAAGKGPAAVGDARARGEALVRKAEDQRTRRVQRARDLGNRAVAAAVGKGDAEVRAAIQAGGARVIGAARLSAVLVRAAEQRRDREVRAAVDRRDRAVDAAESAHAAYTSGIDARVKELRSLAGDKKVPKADAKQILRWDRAKASGQRKQFEKEMTAADPGNPNLRTTGARPARGVRWGRAAPPAAGPQTTGVGPGAPALGRVRAGQARPAAAPHHVRRGRTAGRNGRATP